MFIYKEIGNLLNEGRHGILATIIKRAGATPQGVGAKVMMDDTGRVHGTIGGGCVEAEVWREARNIMDSGETRLIRYDMTGTEVAEEGMICGGYVEVFLEPVANKMDLYKELNLRLKNGTRTLVITGTEENKFFKSLLSEDGRVFGDSIDPAMVQVLLDKFREKQLLLIDGLLIEPISNVSRVFIYGAGHISQFISKIAKLIDFDVIVIDDRSSFANRERFPEADKVIAGYFTESIREIDPVPSDFHVIVTRGHKNDAEVLEEVLKKPSKYVGMIGSKRKIKLVYDHLKAKGFDSAQLEKVHAPIGLGIDAQTPQEIAVSIAAELIQIRAKNI